MIKLNQISKIYGSLNALNNFTIEFKNGETSVLIGPSGCGKSTVIRILTGLAIPEEGNAFIDGEEISQESLTGIRRKIGYVIQEGGLFPHLTARENLSLMPQFFKWKIEKITSKINELIELTNFPEIGLNKYPTQLSGGQRQRISLMRALMLDPDILLLDEPLGALDPLIRYDLQEELKIIFKKLNKTVVLVTHDLSEAMFFADQLILMRDGRIEQKGKPEEILNSPKNDFVKKFINAQRINMNSGRGI